MGNAEPAAAKVLVIEDDASMRDLLRLHLVEAGYEVMLAEDATVAGRQLLVALPDLIISDIQLPYMSGVEFASVLMADSTLPHIPVLLISSHEDYRDQAEALGAAFLLKPILKTKLLEAVEKTLPAEKSARPGKVAPAEPVWIGESVSQATLRRARDLAGGVSFLGRRLGIGSGSLDAMICGNQETPQWVFLRAADFISEAEPRASGRQFATGLFPDWAADSTGTGA